MDTIKHAVISKCKQYRYLLKRVWDERLPEASFIMLNPSTADAYQDDATIRRCIGFAKSLGCGALNVVNLYAYRATKPSDLFTRSVSEAVGPENDAFLHKVLHYPSLWEDVIIAAWGVHARPERVKAFAEIVKKHGLNVKCLGTTKAGAPKHPLYLPADTALQPFRFVTK
jgi:hypothetical protein